MTNNGYDELKYTFGENSELNIRMSNLINEFCHVFHCHADGNWKSEYKPKYVELMAREIRAQPSLICSLLELNDRVVSNVTYAAIQFNKGGDVDDSKVV